MRDVYFSLVVTWNIFHRRYCPTCQDFVQAMKQMSMFRLPDVLIIHLKVSSSEHVIIYPSSSKSRLTSQAQIY